MTLNGVWALLFLPKATSGEQWSSGARLTQPTIHDNNAVPMRNLCCLVLLLFWTASGYAQSNSYLFVWAGDDTKKSSDFLAVLDADSKSPHYGQAVASVAVPGPSGTPHHTELEMPEGCGPQEFRPKNRNH